MWAAALGLTVSAAHANGNVSDAQALAISARHCVSCHARHPTHRSVREAPKNVSLETVEDLKAHARTVFEQTVKTRAMPLGDETGMREEERAMLGEWIRHLRRD